MKKHLYSILIACAAILTGCVNDDDKPEIPQGESPVRINEAYSRGKDGDYPLDWVELYNPSSEAVDIGGYILSDKLDKSESVTLPAGTRLAAKGFLRVEVDIEGGFGLSSGGDMVYLYDASGAQVDYVEFGAMELSESWAANPDGSTTFRMQSPTPGASNDDAVAVPSIDDLLHTPASPTADEDVTVSATVAAGEGTIASIELQWSLGGAAQTPIAMSASGNSYSATIARQVAGATIAYAVVAKNSAGGETSETGGYSVRDAAVVDYTGLVINEVDGINKFVELYNNSAAAISLSGVKLIKNGESDAGDIWWTGGSVSIAPGGFHTIGEEGSTTSGLDEATGNGGISPKKNVQFELLSPADAPIDIFTRATTLDLDENCTPDYGKTTPPYAFARCPDGIGAFGLAEPSCGAANPFQSAGAILTDEASSQIAALVINEVDGNGKFIELYNPTDEAISLQGVTLYKNLDLEEPWWTGVAQTIPAKGFYTIAEEGSKTPGVSEASGDGGISPKKTVRFDMVLGNTSLDCFARVKADNAIDVDCTPDYGKTDPKYSFSRCPDGSGAFGLAVPSANAANPAAAAGPILTE